MARILLETAVLVALVLPALDLFAALFGLPALGSANEDMVADELEQSVVWTFIMVVVIGPTVEEVLFRGPAAILIRLGLSVDKYY